MAEGYELDWDTVIEKDEPEFVLLPEGDYEFTVVGFDRGRFPGGKKTPPCKKAELTLEVTTASGTATVHTDLILYSSFEWKIASFFRSIGQKKHGEKLVVNWNNVIGARGRAHISVTTWTGRDGIERQSNDVSKFLDPDPTAKASAAPKADPVDDLLS